MEATALISVLMFAKKRMCPVPIPTIACPCHPEAVDLGVFSHERGTPVAVRVGVRVRTSSAVHVNLHRPPLNRQRL